MLNKENEDLFTEGGCFTGKAEVVNACLVWAFAGKVSQVSETSLMEENDKHQIRIKSAITGKILMNVD